ncbi:MAG: adenine phosphoribosyltransferase [Candidatus Latescibacteria bacterium]|nr:adenine phosphoribosyltransferase [Candidatus Latescibacterota bacterium]
MDLGSIVRDIPDFPKPGILFKDITTLLKNAQALSETITLLTASAEGLDITMVAGIESRGFIFGAAVAKELDVGFVPIRKPGKLPAKTISESYELEYGTDTVEMHADALSKKDRVLLIDDLLATGGTMKAAVKLVEKTGAEVSRIVFVIELTFLNGRDKLADYDVISLISY